MSLHVIKKLRPYTTINCKT